MSALLRILLAAVGVFALQEGALGQGYPELQPYLQRYQNPPHCYPNNGEWVMTKRNFPYDPHFGGSAKCVKYERIGPVMGSSMNVRFSWCQDGYGRGCGASVGRYVLTSTPGYSTRNQYNFLAANGYGSFQMHTIFKDCSTCFVGRYRYALNGHGCVQWRRVSHTFNRRADYCDFIFDLFCGNSPRYYMYDNTCSRSLGVYGGSSYGWWKK
uniref:Putative lipocal-1 1 n=1 Tax=Hyalomma excavatum TaxID=257692 RepID=A0A131XNF5_9ACAR